MSPVCVTRCLHEIRDGPMHVQRPTIENIRSIRKFELDLRPAKRAGWHVILGGNGAGKSTVVRSLALALMGQSNAHAARQGWSRWLTDGSNSGHVTLVLSGHDEDSWTGQGRTSQGSITAKASITAESEGSKQNGRQAAIDFSSRNAKRTIWGDGYGWFSASFGPFRRFSGGDREMDRLYVTHPRLASHLSAFGENVALGESLLWLQDLQIKKLEKDGEAETIQNAVISFINRSDVLPHGARIAGVASERVVIVDGRGAEVAVEEMSDGYRSILSLTFELMRLMFWAFGTETALAGIDAAAGTIALPGVVAIDEIDAHLHPAWQQRIGEWFVGRFPETQFFVTTHSPIICRAARHGSVWLLPKPGSEDKAQQIVGSDLDRLIDGNILDAYGTDLFGEEVTRSERSKEKLEQLARLNRRRLKAPLSLGEQSELERLRATMPSNPSKTAPSQKRERKRFKD